MLGCWVPWRQAWSPAYKSVKWLKIRAKKRPQNTQKNGKTEGNNQNRGCEPNTPGYTRRLWWVYTDTCTLIFLGGSAASSAWHPKIVYLFVNGPYDTAITRSTYVMTLIYTAAALLSLVYQVPGRYFCYVIMAEGVYEVRSIRLKYTRIPGWIFKTRKWDVMRRNFEGAKTENGVDGVRAGSRPIKE